MDVPNHTGLFEGKKIWFNFDITAICIQFEHFIQPHSCSTETIFIFTHPNSTNIPGSTHLSAWHSWGLVFPLLRCLYQQYKFCHAFQTIHQCPATLRQRRSCAGYTRLPCNNAVFNEIFPCLSGHLTRFILFGLGFFELTDFQHK